MELSCDERVMRGADANARKAYTETLLSTMHRQYQRQSMLTTQFYGGKQIMKKRFKNILSGSGKKNGLAVFAGLLVVTVSMATLVGCRTSEADAVKTIVLINEAIWTDRQENFIGGDAESLQEKQDGSQANAANTETQSGMPEDVANTVDQDEIRAVIEAFSNAYFGGNAEALRPLLAASFEGNIDVYEGISEESGTISELRAKGLPGEDGQPIGDGPYEVWLEFRDSSYDNFWYVNFLFVRENGSWKIQFYGLEG